MATSLHNNPPVKAGGNIYPFRFVRLSGDLTVVQASANNQKTFGISGPPVRVPPNFVEDLTGQAVNNYHAISGEEPEIFRVGQYTLLECGTSWSAGAFLMSDSDGKGLTATSTNPVGAIALEGVSAGELGLVVVTDPFANF